MSPPQRHRIAISHVDLSEAELAKVQFYADQHGLSLDEAATRLVSSALALHYRLARRPMPARVVRLVPKKHFPVTEKKS